MINMLYFTSKMLINEQKMWKMINEVQKRHQNWHFFRLESLTINGIPDVFGCIDGHSFWVELKASKVKNKNNLKMHGGDLKIPLMIKKELYI